MAGPASTSLVGPARLRYDARRATGLPWPRKERNVPKESDADPVETREWVDSLEAVLEIEGPERAHFILDQLVEKARRKRHYRPLSTHRGEREGEAGLHRTSNLFPLTSTIFPQVASDLRHPSSRLTIAPARPRSMTSA